MGKFFYLAFTENHFQQGVGVFNFIFYQDQNGAGGKFEDHSCRKIHRRRIDFCFFWGLCFGGGAFTPNLSASRAQWLIVSQTGTALIRRPTGIQRR